MSKLTISTLSARSSGIYCRICQDNSPNEDLLTPCKCSGTMGFVHSSCLEKWLSRSAQTKCELCKYNFRTKVTCKPISEYFSNCIDVNNERRYVIIDSGCFLLLTPLGIISSWLCIEGAQVYYQNDNFWTGLGLAMLTGFLVMMYLLWIAVTLRYHYLTFKKWQKENMIVRLVFSDHVAAARTSNNIFNNTSCGKKHNKIHDNNNRNNNDALHNNNTGEVVVNIMENIGNGVVMDSGDNHNIDQSTCVVVIDTKKTNETLNIETNV